MVHPDSKNQASNCTSNTDNSSVTHPGCTHSWPHAVSQPLLCSTKFLLFSIHFLLLPVILPTPDEQPESRLGQVSCLDTYLVCQSPFSIIFAVTFTVTSKQQMPSGGESALWGACTLSVLREWAQTILGAEPETTSPVSAWLRVYIVFAPIFFSWSKDSGFPLYSVKPPQQQGWPGTPLLLPRICGGVKL